MKENVFYLQKDKEHLFMNSVNFIRTPIFHDQLQTYNRIACVAIAVGKKDF